MRFMVEWSIPPENYARAMDAFLDRGAPMSPGLKSIGRWHAPGSCRGWLLCEADDLGAVYEHICEWAPLLDLEVTPVSSDEEAASAATRARENR
jgi:hypothetical protein